MLVAGAGVADGSTALSCSWSSARAFSITTLVLRIASLTGTATIGLPAKRLISTWMSDATITTSASATSRGESGSLGPSEPCVSTLMSCPRKAAVFLNAAAAICV